MGVAAVSRPAGRGLLLALAFLAFVSLGLPDTIFGVAWPGLRRTFDVPQSAAGTLFLAAGAGYLATSFNAGRLMRALGVGPLLAGSCGALTACCFGYALAPAFAWLVVFSALAGLGSGAIDASLNAYVSTRYSARHVSWLHASYSLGATVGPLIMTAAVVHAASWRVGYSAVGALMALLALLFVATVRRWDHAPPAAASVGALSALRHPLVLGHAVVFFLYTGLEMTAGAWGFTLLTQARGLDAGPAGGAASLYFGAIGVGRVASGLFADRVDLDGLVRASTAAGVLGAVLLAAPVGPAVNVLGLGLLGLALAPIYPTLMSRTPGRLGPDLASHGFGFQVCAAMLGATLLPAAGGVLAQRLGVDALGPLVVALAVALLAAHERVLRASLASPPRAADNQRLA